MSPVLIYYRQLVSTSLLLLLALTLLSKGPSYGQVLTLPPPEIITSKQGLPQAFVPRILQDHQGFIWMATRDGLCRYDGKNFKVFQPTTDGTPGISSASLADLSLDQQGRIWVFSDLNDIDILDPLREKFINFSRESFFKRQLGHETIQAHYFDQQGRLWLSFLSNRIACIDPVTHYIRQYKLQSLISSHSNFTQDKQGTIWLCFGQRLYKLDSLTDHFIQHVLPGNNEAVRGITLRPNGELFIQLAHSVRILEPYSGRIRSFALPPTVTTVLPWQNKHIVVDNKGNIYFSNQYNDLVQFSEQNGITVLAKLSEKIAVRSLLVDRSDVLWIGTSKDGVRKYNLRADIFKAMPYKHDFYTDLLVQELGLSPAQVPAEAGKAFPYYFRSAIDKNGKLWFNMGFRNFYQLDLQTRQVSPVPIPKAIDLRDKPIAPIATDPEGHVWVITDSLAMWREDDQWRFFQYPIRSKKLAYRSGQSKNSVAGVEGQILQAVVDKQALWLATDTKGLFRIDRLTGQITSYNYDPKNPTSLSSNQLFCLFDDPFDQTILWVGTFGSGLCRFDKRTGSCRRFSTQTGLPNNVIYSAIPDQQGFLWIGTNQGLCRMDRRTFQTRTYTHDDGLLEDEFNRFHYLRLPDDRIIMGGLEGIISFYPRQLKDDTYQPNVQITDIQLNNQSIVPGPLTDSLPVQAINQLNLPYNQNFITIGYAALQYNRQGKTRYRYQLVGLDQQWNETDAPRVQYTDLRWGTYTLKLNASNTSGIWSKYIRVLNLVIRPPWWATWWAILLYMAGAVVVAYTLVRSYLNQQEAKQLKKIDSIKARFFTNIAHEFRTPLTLIMGPVETLKKRLSSHEDQYQLNLINQNAAQILELINQLIDLSKAEANVLRLNESLGDLKASTQELVHSFQAQAQSQNIQLTFQAESEPLQYWFDAEKLARIITNLLANALKFTPKGGQVNVALRIAPPELIPRQIDQSSWIQLIVSDTGIGILPEKLPYIFDRFYQAENGDHDLPESYEIKQQGTGIGLALVKELIDFQSGTIQVSSHRGSGTTFTIFLPYRSVTNLPVMPPLPVSEWATQPEIIEAEITSNASSSEKKSQKGSLILVVEDNKILRDFIVENLSKTYTIHQAKNGSEGWDQAINVVPDLIISDVMMPIMDGYTLCNKLKKDPRTSHIPVVLLTAKASVDERLEGLSLGADDYIIKPFHIQELQLRIRNLLEQRRQLQQWVLASITSTTPSTNAPATTDPLIEKLCQLVEEHLDETTFGAEELTVASGMSRMNLHRKLRALADTSAGEFIRNYRLKRAAQFLREGRSVSETAYLVGFEDPSYFARSFRKVYQMAPSTFSRNN